MLVNAAFSETTMNNNYCNNSTIIIIIIIYLYYIIKIIVENIFRSICYCYYYKQHVVCVFLSYRYVHRV
jgi:hypothetical protein